MTLSIEDSIFEDILKWMDSFPKENTGAIGGRFTFMITPTSLGTVVKMKDEITGEIKDFTDYDSW